MKILHDSPRYAVKTFGTAPAYLVIDKTTGLEALFWGEQATAFASRWEASPCAKAREAKETAEATVDALLARLLVEQPHD